ncbi:MAG TPA: hypothetical protein VJ307_05955 [Candidatus Deferrimicrobiaceae bacterium]|jgi:hypothetical protein|nr:hypothetical protein [Candidatus Deferrimicrobiaceae bacterium]
MNRAGVTVTTLITTLFLLSASFIAAAEETRGPTGLPSYIKSPSDRPPPAGIEPVIVAPDRTPNDLLASISRNDSVLVISGKVNLGGRDYFYAYPKFRAGSLYGAMKACRKEYLMRPQYKATESVGYTMLVVLKDTGTNPDCWAQFRNLGGVDVSCDQILVKITEKDEPVAWDNPDSSYSNSYDLRSLNLGPVAPR